MSIRRGIGYDDCNGTSNRAQRWQRALVCKVAPDPHNSIRSRALSFPWAEASTDSVGLSLIVSTAALFAGSGTGSMLGISIVNGSLIASNFFSAIERVPYLTLPFASQEPVC